MVKKKGVAAPKDVVKAEARKEEIIKAKEKSKPTKFGQPLTGQFKNDKA